MMPIKYTVITGHELPKTKQRFDCFCEAKKHVKKMLAKAPPALTVEEMELSVRMIRTDESVYRRAAEPFPV